MIANYLRTLGAIVAAVAISACTTEGSKPAPRIIDVSPLAICPNAETEPVQVVILGAGFQVGDDHVVDSLVELVPHGGSVGTPKLPLLEGDLAGGTLRLEFANGEFTDGANAPPAAYDLRVTNPDGQKDTFAKPLLVASDFSGLTVSPQSAAAGPNVTLTLTGNGFFDPMTAEIETSVGALTRDVQVISPTEAHATFDLTGAAPGTYAVTMRNVGGCSVTKVSAFTVQ